MPRTKIVLLQFKDIMVMPMLPTKITWHFTCTLPASLPDLPSLPAC
jgi:hypothetical protein